MKWLILAGLLGHWGVAGGIGSIGEQNGTGGRGSQGRRSSAGFSLLDQHGQTHTLKEYAGKWLVLYFYPKDDTPGCTQEACAFRDDLHQLTDLGAQVVGISVDDSNSHAEFAEKYHLPFPLLADKSTEVAERYGVLMNLLLIKVARRYTFLINPQGKIYKVYDKVETSRHSKEIIEDMKRVAGKV